MIWTKWLNEFKQEAKLLKIVCKSDEYSDYLKYAKCQKVLYNFRDDYPDSVIDTIFNMNINMVWSNDTGVQGRKWALNFSDGNGTVWEVFKHYRLNVLAVRGELREIQ